MRMRKLLCMSLLAVAVAGCVRPLSDGQDTVAPVTITLDDGVPVSRTTSAAKEETVSEWAVLVCRQSTGAVVASASSSASSITLKVAPGTYDIHAVVNAGYDPSSVKNVSSLTGMRVSLTDNSLTGGLVMYGSRTGVSVTASGGTVTVPVKRLVSKVQLDRVSVDFSGRPDLAAKTFRLESVYLINVAGDAVVGSASSPSSWYNKRGYLSSVADGLLYDAVNRTLTSSAPYSVPHYFYACENVTSSDSQSTTWSARYTRLVLRCSIGGTVYYYSINIPKMTRNSVYRITDAVIKDRGSLEEDRVVSDALDVTFSTSVSWGDTYNVEEQS